MAQYPPPTHTHKMSQLCHPLFGLELVTELLTWYILKSPGMKVRINEVWLHWVALRHVCLLLLHTHTTLPFLNTIRNAAMHHACLCLLSLLSLPSLRFSQVEKLALFYCWTSLDCMTDCLLRHLLAGPGVNNMLWTFVCRPLTALTTTPAAANKSRETLPPAHQPE